MNTTIKSTIQFKTSTIRNITKISLIKSCNKILTCRNDIGISL